MLGMFYHASAFNQPLNDWRVDKVTNMYGWRVDKLTDVELMFEYSAFSHWEDLGDSKLRSQEPSAKPSAKPCCAIS